VEVGHSSKLSESTLLITISCPKISYILCKSPSSRLADIRTIRIPFHNPSHALIALRGLQVDKEQNSIFVQRQLTTEGPDLIV
jgi:hypothetical protein